MEYQIEQVSEVVKKIKITATQEEVKEMIEKVCGEIRKTAKVPGFRPGKAPISTIKRYFSDTVKENLLTTIISQELAQILEKENINPLRFPNVASYEVDLEKNQLKSLEFLVEVKPEIELKPEDYKGIKVKKTAREIGDEDVEKVIEGLRNRLVKWNEVERESKEGDLVEVEYEVKSKDGEEEKGKVSVVLGSNQVWKEIEDNISGKKKGEEGTISFKAPDDKKYGKFAGKEVEVKFKVLSVKEKELPEVNDEFAKKYGFENLEEMKKQIREDLETAEETRRSEEVENQIVDHLLSKIDVPVPPSLLEMEIVAQAELQLRRLSQLGARIESINPQSVVEMVRPMAERTAKIKLILEKVAELENIEVSDKDVEEEIKKIADSLFEGDYVTARQSLEEKGLLPLIRMDVLRQKALDKLVELAEVEEVSS